MSIDKELIVDDRSIGRIKYDYFEHRLLELMDTSAKKLSSILMALDIEQAKWETATEYQGKKYRLEWSVIEEAEK